MIKRRVTTLLLTMSLLSFGTPILADAAPQPVATTHQVARKYSVPGQQISLKGAVNVRDLGGYRTVSGKYIKPNKIVRSASLAALTKNDKVILTKGHHVGVDVDLRTHTEMKSAPDAKMTGVSVVVDPVLSDASVKGSQQTAKMTGEQTMAKGYKAFVDSPKARGAFRTLFQQLLAAPSNKAVLYHCTGGKDRTDIGTALILTALGVDKKTIYSDYLLSNKYRKAANQEVLATLQKKGATEKQLAFMKAEMACKKEYLDATYQEATKKYGSMKGFITKGLGISNAQIRVLQSKYLEK